MNVDDEKQLVEQIVKGDLKAFNRFMDRYERLVAHVVFRLVQSEADREDVCQEIFIKIYQSLGSFLFQSRMSTWVGKIAYNTCINYLEKKKVPLYDDHLPDEGGVFQIPADELGADELVEKGELEMKIQAEIKNLPPSYRAVLTLYHLDQMSYDEISDILSMPQGTVKNYLFRARKYLKDRLLCKYAQEELYQ
jgi:RNA polymerase sigma factor (sigma-70 family)